MHREPAASLEEAVERIEGLARPPAVEEDLFADLQAELRRVMLELYEGSPAEEWSVRRAVSAVDNSAWGLQGIMLPTDTVTAAWHGRHTGDYNLDGLVGVSDLTPLGIHYNATAQLDGEGIPVIAGDNEWIVAVDGNGDGLVNLSDITQIGQNYNSVHLGYRLYTGISFGGADVVWSESFLPGIDPQNTDVTVPFNSSKDAGLVNHYSFSFTKPVLGTDDVLYIRVVAYNGSVESAPVDAHLIAGPHAPLYCETCHMITTMAFRGVAETCKTCHATPPEDATASWDDTPITHGVCFGCHSAHGYSPDPPQTVCTKCHSATEEDVAAAGMPDCLGCHKYAHIPNLIPEPQDCESCHAGIVSQLGDGGMQDCAMCHGHHEFTNTYTTENCMVCHPTPPDVTEGTWAQSPGPHNSCAMCHGQHQFQPELPNSLCTTCHSDVVGSGHGMNSDNCLGCHGNAHVPATEMDPANCVSCHTNPPEDATMEWTEAPGAHSTCAECHSGPGHGDKPDPPESICGSCHNDLIIAEHAGGSTACLLCHTYPHVPDTSIAQDDCLICHTNPPEDLAAEWVDAPGSHNQCLLCHSGTNHGDKPAPAESVCADCHGALISGGHAAGHGECLDCHTWAHVPAVRTNHEIHTGFVDCSTCHNPSPSDIPVRATCTACHTGRVDHQPGIECRECHGN